MSEYKKLLDIVRKYAKDDLDNPDKNDLSFDDKLDLRMKEILIAGYYSDAIREWTKPSCKDLCKNCKYGGVSENAFFKIRICNETLYGLEKEITFTPKLHVHEFTDINKCEWFELNV